MKTKQQQGFPICQKCKNGEMVYREQIESLGSLGYKYKCDNCGATKWLGLIPEEGENEN